MPPSDEAGRNQDRLPAAGCSQPERAGGRACCGDHSPTPVVAASDERTVRRQRRVDPAQVLDRPERQPQRDDPAHRSPPRSRTRARRRASAASPAATAAGAGRPRSRCAPGTAGRARGRCASASSPPRASAAPGCRSAGCATAGSGAPANPRRRVAGGARRRGEHGGRCPQNRASGGLSPQARGTRTQTHNDQLEARLIPAGTGNTPAASRASGSATAHPRKRGEHLAEQRQRARAFGSSPQAWGTRPVAGVSQDRVRLISAGTGNTSRRTPRRG